MPGQIFVDSEALREFCTQLKKFSEVLDESTAKTQSQLAKLGDSWRDEGFEEFKNATSRIFPVVKRLVEEVNQTIPKLHRDAELIDEYNQGKPT